MAVAKKKTVDPPVKKTVDPPVNNNWKPLNEQGGITKIGNMTAEDATEAFDKPGYKLDLSKSKKGWRGTRWLYQPYYVKSNEKPKREEITAKLPTKKLVSKPIDKSIQKSSTQKKVAAEKPKFEPAPKTKKLTKGGGRTGNIGTAIKNVVGKQVFKKEEKMSGAYKRATSASGTGSQAGMNKADRSIDLKDQVKNLKSVRKDVKKSTGYDVKKDIKDTKKALKWSEKVGSGKNRYLSISGRKK
jgi:uncharacterized protein YcfJ